MWELVVFIDPMDYILLRPHCEAKTIEVFLELLKGTDVCQFNSVPHTR